jgi:hypothetical protein
VVRIGFICYIAASDKESKVVPSLMKGYTTRIFERIEVYFHAIYTLALYLGL